MNRQEIIEKFKTVRAFTENICSCLEIEDYVVQAVEDVSPAKWHLAHTSWFFETFILTEFDKNYKVFDENYNFLFNSYYNAVGPQWFRASRGHLSRPTVSKIYDYRKYIDKHTLNFLEAIDNKTFNSIKHTFEIGLNHEQQHQELLLTDIKYNLAINPLFPVYKPLENIATGEPADLNFLSFDEGLYEIGFSKKTFCYDNELPRHKVWLNSFNLANRLISNREYLDFINDDGYQNPIFWLSDGWATVQLEKWECPLYWHKIDGDWKIFTLHGLMDLDLDEPVCHISQYEADAYASWAGKRLPTEFEWEIASGTVSDPKSDRKFSEDGIFHPKYPEVLAENKLSQMLGTLWEWTSSAYLPYPSYKNDLTALGEYNGKFMSGQMVLRGGSVATPENHIRTTYRNFFQPGKRWQFNGIRLAEDN